MNQASGTTGSVMSDRREADSVASGGGQAGPHEERPVGPEESLSETADQSMTPESGRLDRNWGELLQELRVAQTGVQILTGFLLTIPFTPRFAGLPTSTHIVYGCVLCISVVTIVLLMTPVALHRALFHRGERPWLVDTADTAARVGLASMSVSIVGVLWMILDVISSRIIASVASVVLASAIVWLWVILPRRERHRSN